MLKKEYIFCFLFGLLGTALGNLFLTPETLHAFGSNNVRADYFAVNSRSGGKRKLELATYDGSHTKAERDLPLIALYDRQDKLRLLFRLAGSNESPALILKDSEGRDRMVLGLALHDKNEDPYISFYDKNGKRKNAAWSLFTN